MNWPLWNTTLLFHALLICIGVSVKEVAFSVGVAFAIHAPVVVGTRWRSMFIVLSLLPDVCPVLTGELVGFAPWTGDSLYRFHTTAVAYRGQGLWQARQPSSTLQPTP